MSNSILDTVTGFAVIASAILVGYLIGRINLLGETARPVLTRLTFFVLNPLLIFVVLAEADVRLLFSALLPISALAVVVVVAAYALVARVAWRRSIGETLIGALAAAQVNSNNIGIPISYYILGNAAYPVAVVLLQQLVMTPISIAILEHATTGRGALKKSVLRTVTNPVIIASILGTTVSLSGLSLGNALEPARFLADACLPILLMSFGISLHGQRLLASPGRRRDIVLASALKLVAMPLVAWAIAEYWFDVTSSDVLAVTVLAALPTAQLVFMYSQHYAIGQDIARETVLVTTVGCAVVIPVVLLLLH